jgi:hypothetical protein
MKKLVFLFIAIFPLLAFAQDGEWTLHKQENGVIVYQMDKIWEDPSEGINQEMVLLKFVNTTDQKLKIDWYDVRWYGGKCSNCDNYKDPEHHHSITLEPGESIEGKCSFDSPRALSVFKRFLNHEDVEALTKFELRDFNVNPA